MAAESRKAPASGRRLWNAMRLRSVAGPRRTPGLANPRNPAWTGVVGWLISPVARWRRAKVVQAAEEYPGARWCDRVEREVNNKIIYGDPRGGNRPW